MQITGSTDSEHDDDTDNNEQDIFKVFTTEKKRHAGRPPKLPEAVPATIEVIPEAQVTPPKSNPTMHPRANKNVTQDFPSKPPAQY
jgi:hypothetical protein